MIRAPRPTTLLSLLTLCFAPATPARAQVAVEIPDACTSLLVTKGASTDGSVMITYTCDGEYHPHLSRRPAAEHEAGSFVEKVAGGVIPQVPHTYATVGLINEHQLAIGETTFGGRSELVDREGALHYWDMMQLALQRARTAREAVSVMTSLVAEHGYRSSGESFSIGDTEEAWILEMIGKGTGSGGAVWVAVRIPDGEIAAHANKARIGAFPLDDPESCLYSPDVVTFAVEKGYYDPDSGEPFSFCEAYCPSDVANLRITEARVWSLFRRAAPSLELSPDYHRGVRGARRYPLSIRPDAKLAVEDVFALMRDHYEGTEFDMTVGVDAGPYGNPFRLRPLFWEVDGVKYAWERPISTFHTAYSMVTQSRGHLPDEVGGVMWYGLDDTEFTCYAPFYCCIDALPEAYTVGGIQRFTWDSAWWTFNLVANVSNLMYAPMIEEVRAVRGELEGTMLALQPAVERTAVDLLGSDPELAKRYLTDYSVTHGDQVVKRWRELGVRLITGYNDGYRDRRDVGYPEAWLRRVVGERGEAFRLDEGGEEDPTHL